MAQSSIRVQLSRRRTRSPRSTLRWRRACSGTTSIVHALSNDEAYGILRRLIEDERSHHEMLDKLMSDLMELYGEQLVLDSE